MRGSPRRIAIGAVTAALALAPAAPERTVASESRPAASESRPAASESRPAASESRPAASEIRPAASESRPVASESRPAAPAGGSSLPSVETLVRAHDRSVVAVSYQLRPRERPKGGEGAKVRKLLCAVLAGPAGQIVMSGNPFPSIDDGPEALEPFDFRLVLPGKVEVPVEVVGVDRELNMTFLRADPARLGDARPVTFTSPVEAAVGEELLLIGLLSEEYGYAPALYFAHVSAVVDKPRRAYALDIVVQDLAIGGLVLKRDGTPLGLVGEDPIGFWRPGRTEQMPGNSLSLQGSAARGLRPGYPIVLPYQTLAASLADPPRQVEERLESRGWLGISMQPLSRDLADYWEIESPGGVIIQGVYEGSPADASGLRAGDVILKIGEEPLPVRESRDLALVQKLIRSTGAGRAIPFAVWRDGSVRTVEIRLGSSPQIVSTAEEFESETFGLKVRELTYDYLQAANLEPATPGVLVVDLERAGWAQIAGLSTGDIIQRVAGEPVAGLTEFRQALERAETARPAELVLFVLRGYQTLFLRIKPDWPRR